MRRLWELQAEKIEMVLASHNITARVRGGVITPRFIRYQLYPEVGTRLNKIRDLAEEIALFLGVQNCRIYRLKGVINVEIPRSRSRSVSLLHLCARLAEVPPCTPVLGLDEEGMPLLLSLPSPDVAHVLISGTTGSGKTELARTMIASLAMYNHQGRLQLVLIDPKRRGFGVFEGLPHLLAPITTDVEEAISLLGRLVKEMERRDKEGIGEPHVVIFIDELAELTMAGTREAELLLTRLTQRGREAGLHVVACTQKPTASVLGSLAKANFPVRLVGRVTTPEEAKVATGLAKSGAEKLLGRGDFLVVSNGLTIRFQAAYISPAQIKSLVNRIRNRAIPARKAPDARKPGNFLTRHLRLIKTASGK